MLYFYSAAAMVSRTFSVTAKLWLLTTLAALAGSPPFRYQLIADK